MNFQYEASGGLSLSGKADVVSPYHTYSADGGMSVSGESEAQPNLQWEADGGLSLSGEADVQVTLYWQGSGGLSVLTTPFNPVIATTSGYFDLELQWSVQKLISKDLTLVWDTGPSDLYFYRIQCECISDSDPCATTNFDSNDGNCGNNPPAGFTTIKYIAATDASDLCAKLKRGYITQPFQCNINRIQRFSRPLNKDRIAELEAQGHDLSCNELIDVSIDNVQECLDFNVDENLTQTIGFTMTVTDSLNSAEGDGGFTIGGSADARVVPQSAIGDGGFAIGGSAGVTSTHWNYTPSAETSSLIISGQSPITYFDWDYEGDGGFEISGQAGVVSPNQSYIGDGGISLSGSAGLFIRYSFTPINPQLVISGTAGAHPATYIGNGEVLLGGSALVTSSYYSYDVDSTDLISFSGEANVVSSAFSWVGSGGLSIGSSASLSWYLDGSGGFGVSGEADVTWIQNIESEGGFEIGGSADVVSPYYSYESSGGLSIGGSGLDSFLGDYITEMAMSMAIDSIGVTFGEDTGEPLSIGENTVTSSCGCGDIPQILQMKHNFINSRELSSFVKRNGSNFPNTVSLTYRRRTQSWSKNFHFVGNAPSSTGIETWDIFFDFSCTDTYGGESLQTNIWKFCAFFKRKNLTTGADDDSRIVFTFPSTDVCPTGVFVKLDYSFAYDTQEKSLLTSTGGVGTNTVVNDGLKLFSSREWQLDPDLEIRITAVAIEDVVDRIDITPLFPFDPTAPLLTVTSN